jgi:aspartate aminotransferase
MVIINSPNNPTGAVYNEEIIIELSKILKEKEKEYSRSIYLLSDEPYRELIYDNISYPFITNYHNNSIVVYSFSKSLSLPGERIGYILLNNKMENVDDIYYSVLGSGRALGFVCATTIFQKLIPYILGHTSNILEYKQNKDFLYKELCKIGYKTNNPEGAFYLFVKALEDDDNHFVEVAKKFELLLVPSESFGMNGYVRISYCVSFEQIKNSIPAFKKLYDYYRK